MEDAVDLLTDGGLPVQEQVLLQVQQPEPLKEPVQAQEQPVELQQEPEAEQQQYSDNTFEAADTSSRGPYTS